MRPRRPIPGTGDSLPVIGLGNSNAFRQNDVSGSTALIKHFHENGGAYIDCSGDSRFVVADVASSLDIGNDLFLGTYSLSMENISPACGAMNCLPEQWDSTVKAGRGFLSSLYSLTLQ